MSCIWQGVWVNIYIGILLKKMWYKFGRVVCWKYCAQLLITLKTIQLSADKPRNVILFFMIYFKKFVLVYVCVCVCVCVWLHMFSSYFIYLQSIHVLFIMKLFCLPFLEWHLSKNRKLKVRLKKYKKKTGVGSNFSSHIEKMSEWKYRNAEKVTRKLFSLCIQEKEGGKKKQSQIKMNISNEILYE